MPRTLRLDFPGARHHVMNRASRHRTLFRTEADRALFLDVLAELPGRYALAVHGWALMGNHYHLMIEVTQPNLAHAMGYLGGELGRRLNGANGWDGPVFRGRYRNRLVLDEPYWRHLLAYVHNNPVRAGLVAHPDESTWTSHRAYSGLDPAPPWLTQDALLDLYGSKALYWETMADLAAGQAALPEAFSEAALWRPPSTRDGALVRVPATVSALSPEVALGQVRAALGATEADLRAPVRGRGGNDARRLAAWWLLRATALRREHIGRLLGMSAGAVGNAASRVRRAEAGALAAARDELMAAWWGPMMAEEGEVQEEKEMGTA